MSSSFWCTDSINKRNLLELTISYWNNDFPSLRIDLLVKNFYRRWFLIEVKINIFKKLLDVNLSVIQWDFDSWKEACHVINSFWQQCNYVLIESVWHIKKFKAWEKSDLNKVFAGIWGQFTFIVILHVVSPSHFEFLFVFWITTFDNKFIGENIG